MQQSEQRFLLAMGHCPHAFLLLFRKKERERMNKVWARVFDQNYHKSLDHRSFYFKQVLQSTQCCDLCFSDCADLSSCMHQVQSVLACDLNAAQWHMCHHS